MTGSSFSNSKKSDFYRFFILRMCLKVLLHVFKNSTNYVEYRRYGKDANLKITIMVLAPLIMIGAFQGFAIVHVHVKEQ